MYISMIEIMKIAKEQHFCVPAPAVENEHCLRAAIAAAEELNSPLILISLFKANPDIRYFGRIVEDAAVRSRVPIALCQDHGGSYEEAIWAIRSGFSDIMVDRSGLPFEENVKQVKELVKIAHAVGVGVEAELGHVGMASNGDETNTSGFTMPDEAVEFVKQTGVDALAVAIGTAHGPYKGIPKIHFDLLHELQEKLAIPLVLHGGSGTGEENLRRACANGICKLNLSNDLKRAAIDALDTTGVGAYKLYPLLAEGYKQKLMEYMDICGSTQKADLYRK